MSLQDKIFDVTAALEGLPEGDDFDHIIQHLNDVESVLHDAAKKNEALVNAIRTIASVTNYSLVIASLQVLLAAGNAETYKEAEDILVNAENHPNFDWDALRDLMGENKS